MDNLINFEEDNSQKQKTQEIPKNSLETPLFVTGRPSLDLNNPFDKLEYRAIHFDDPFECLEIKKEAKDPVKDL